MTPNDIFSYLEGHSPVYDTQSLAKVYQPILGVDAVGLYAYFVAFWDNGVGKYKFTDILNHMQFGMLRFEESLALLTAMDLIGFYQTTEGYVIDLKPALTITDFLDNPAYRRLLEKRIGEVAVEQFIRKTPEKFRNLSKRFSDVFTGIDEISIKPQRTSQFDWEFFKQRMQSDGLRLVEEDEEVVELYNLAEKYQLTWFELYKIAKQTAYRHVILPKRIKAFLEQEEQSFSAEFTKEEFELLAKVKTQNATEILGEIKKSRKAVITSDEWRSLDELVAMNFLDEVINVMVIYTMAKTKSANLNKSYLMKIANDFAYQDITTAEQAIIKLRSFDQRKKESQPSRRTPKPNVPEWSNPDYKNETTPEEMAKLEEMKRQMLARLGGNE
ncbi:DnaD domain protein [Streptococcus sp. S784/96/1]|uniref:DnaD domain protein n=1 Tax=Streptococcus sp. S784/96/1 TaxID=2653499 RepID=UPI0013895684|nr:DnaD domain protein [Streptococcus sp. S784/96/1]